MTLENIVRSEPKFTSALAGTLRDSVIEAALALWPELTPYQDRRRLAQPAREFDRRAPDERYDAKGNFIPRWRRHQDEGQGLAEYALLLALIAIVAIIAVAFLGEAVKGLLSSVGESI